jgi:phosphate acyltransferase
VRIALDVMGGDLAPKATVEGAVLGARDLGVEMVLVGDREVIDKELAGHDTAGLSITVEHAPEAVAMDESPLESVLAKPNSSIHEGFDLLKRGEVDAFVSAGNSGAVMTAAMVILGVLPGVDRPAIASPVPTSAGHSLLIDAGANTEVKPLNLVQFAAMGSVYCDRVWNVKRPRVAILANGEEASKGNDLTRAASAILRQMSPHVNYVGYVEGRDINHGKADVVVTDGFTGNVALKTMEGFAAFMVLNLHQVFSTSLAGRLGYLLVRRRLREMRERLDPSEYGGAPLLGVSGVAFMAHGSSNAHAIRNAVRACANEALVRHVNAEIIELLAKTPAAMAAKPGGKGFRAIFNKMRDRLHRHSRDSQQGKKAEERREPEAFAGGGEHPEPPPNEDEAGQEQDKAARPLSNGSAGGAKALGDAIGNHAVAGPGAAADGDEGSVKAGDMPAAQPPKGES